MNARLMRLSDAIKTLVEERYPSAEVNRSTRSDRTDFLVVDQYDKTICKNITVMHAFLDERSWQPDDLRTFILESRYFDVVDAATKDERVVFTTEGVVTEKCNEPD
jgi:hypothetical protein